MPDPTIIMVAPNGARKTHKDHPALPVSIDETVDEAVDCFNAGATVLHAHVRGDTEQHVLDAGLYKELLGELRRCAPELLIQITTEAVGIYTPQQQVDCVKRILPSMASISFKEITSNFNNVEFARDFFHWADSEQVHIQHILYSSEELERFLRLKESGTIPESHRCVLFVLGRYATDFQSTPNDLNPFLSHDLSELDWFTCAFGFQEQACVIGGIQKGGHARIGFENNLHQADGVLAISTAAQVTDLVAALKKESRPIANAKTTARILGLS